MSLLGIYGIKLFRFREINRVLIFTLGDHYLSVTGLECQSELVSTDCLVTVDRKTDFRFVLFCFNFSD